MAKIEMPSSSINSTGEPPKKQLKKVTTGKVTIKQESEIQKLAHNFLAEDLQTIREKLWTDYILPGIKNMVCSAVNIALLHVRQSSYHDEAECNADGRLHRAGAVFQRL